MMACRGGGLGGKESTTIQKHFSRTKSLAESRYLSEIMATSPHATRCAPCGDIAIIGDWITQQWELFDKGAGGRVR